MKKCAGIKLHGEECTRRGFYEGFCWQHKNQKLIMRNLFQDSPEIHRERCIYFFWIMKNITIFTPLKEIYFPLELIQNNH